MPTYIDKHKMGKLTPRKLKQVQKSPKDEFGVTHHDLLYNEEEDLLYCVLNAPSKEAVKKHHAAAGIECEWIREVSSTKA